MPRHFEQASRLVTEEQMDLPVGPDPKPYIDMVRGYQDAGFDEVYVANIGPRQEDFFEFWRTKILAEVAA